MTKEQENSLPTQEPVTPVPQEAVQEAAKETTPPPQEKKEPEKAPIKIPVAPEKEKKEVNMNLAMIKETIINYIVPIVCLIASVLIGVFILMPSYKSIPNLNAELDEKTMLEITLRGKLNNMNRLLDFQGIVEENSDLVNKVLVSEELVPGLLTQIDKISREAGMEVSRLNYGLGSSSSMITGGSAIQYSTVTVNLGANGSYSQLMSFMGSVENAARVVLVDNFRYSAKDKDDANLVTVNFVLVSPYLYVESSAVTDGSIDLDIADEEFQTLINKIKGLKYYDPYEIDTSIEIIETAAVEEAEAAEAEGEETAVPVEETVEETVIETVEETESIFP